MIDRVTHMFTCFVFVLQFLTELRLRQNCGVKHIHGRTYENSVVVCRIHCLISSWQKVRQVRRNTRRMLTPILMLQNFKLGQTWPPTWKSAIKRLPTQNSLSETWARSTFSRLIWPKRMSRKCKFPIPSFCSGSNLILLNSFRVVKRRSNDQDSVDF